MTEVALTRKSILDLDVDAIVNPANSFLRHGGGLAAVIERAALDDGWDGGKGDPDLRTATQRWRLAHAKAPLIPVGGAYATPAGVLPFKAVIHTVAPIWGGGSFCETDLIELAHESAFEAASKVGARSIAFPAIGCGIFGCPADVVARIGVAVAQWEWDLDRIVFALPDPEHFAAWERQIDAPLFEG